MSGNIEWTFNVQRDCPRFVPRINELRDQLWDRARPQPLYDGLYMLRPYTAVPRQWLRLTMRERDDSSSAQITVWVRTDNLYVVGFTGTGGTWEFGRRSDQDWRQLLAGSEPLGLDGGYTGANLGELTTGPPQRADLGQQQLVDGIRGLAAYRGGGGGQLRSWLRTIVVTISESIRSQQVCRYIGDLLGQSSSGWLTNKLICIIHNWEKVSLCLIETANDPDIPGRYRWLRASGVCGNTYEARQVAAILYHGPVGNSSSRQKRSAASNDTKVVDDVDTGLTFVEVLDVVVDNDGDSCDLYGTVTVDDGLNPPVEVFRREWANTQPVGPRASGLELTGPSRAIWGYDEVVFDLDLMSRDTVPDMSPGDIISNEQQLLWNAHQKPETEYNKPKECTVDGGAVKIRYAVFTNAVVATVEVRLSSESDPPDLYGSILASTPALYLEYIALFKREHKDCVSLRAGDTIPLLRTVLVVPLRSFLDVYADLWNRSFVRDMSPDDHIADERARFSPQVSGVENHRLYGPNGYVTVSVTWSPE